MKIVINKPLILFTWMILFCSGNWLYSVDFDIEINTGTTYDSNVYRSFIEPKKDAYFTFAPKTSLKLPLNKLFFDSSLRMAIEQHISENDANLQELIFSGLGRYNTSDYISFGLKNDVIISGRLKSTGDLSDYTNPREFLDNKLNFSFKYDLSGGKLLISINYGNSIRNYFNSEKDDWMTHSGNTSIGYKLGHRTSVQIASEINRKGYFSDLNYISIPITGSIKRDWTSKINTNLAFGLESRRYNNIDDDRNWNKPTFSFEISDQLTGKTSSRLLLQYKVYDSDIELYTGYAFTSIAFDTSLALKLNDYVKMILKGLYSENDYINIKRIDDVFGGHIQFRYRLPRWGSIALGYGYEWRDSNIMDSNYQQHVVDLYFLALF